MLFAMRRRRDELARLHGLAATHLFATVELSGVASGVPTPRRWALLCGWERREAADAFLHDSPILRDFDAGAREAWHVLLEPVRVMLGEWRGWRPDTDGVAPPADDEPVAVLTYGRLRRRYVPAFLVNNARAVAQARRSPGLLADLGLLDRVRAASTFSLWRSQDDVVRFAYGGGDHAPIARRSIRAPWAEDYFFARFRPIASRGTWNGRDPVAEALAGRQAAVAPAQA